MFQSNEFKFAVALCLLLVLILGCAPTRRVEGTKDTVVVTSNNEVMAKLQTVWDEQMISAISTAPIPPGYSDDAVGRSLARKAAITQCYADLYRQVGDVKLTETVTVVNAAVMAQNTMELEGTIHGAQIIEDRWDSTASMYKISMSFQQDELVKYVKEWVDNGTVNVSELDRFIAAMRSQ